MPAKKTTEKLILPGLHDNVNRIQLKNLKKE